MAAQKEAEKSGTLGDGHFGSAAEMFASACTSNGDDTTSFIPEILLLSPDAKVLVSVRDRLHLADVMRTLKRSSTVLRVSRSKQ